jgi:TctA family transporter
MGRTDAMSNHNGPPLAGVDDQTGQMRFAFGVPELMDGIDGVVLAVGLFAVGEALYVAAYQSRIQ